MRNVFWDEIDQVLCFTKRGVFFAAIVLLSLGALAAVL